MTTVDIMLAPRACIDRAWAEAYPLLKRVWDEGLGINDEVTIEDIQYDVLIGDRQLWLCNTPDRFVAALVTQIVPYRYGYSCDLNIYANVDGYKDTILRWMPTLKDWAVKQGCNYMRIKGRLGWKKVLQAEGFELKSITMCAELTKRVIN